MLAYQKKRHMSCIPREETNEGLQQQVQTGGHAHSLRGVAAWTVHHSVIVSHQCLQVKTESCTTLP